jgi:lycopene cyclase domain-containing protein
MEKYYFIAVDFVVFLIPFLFAFDKRIQIISTYKKLIPALISMAALFTIWDVVFTNTQIRTFNPEYVIGYYFLNIPIEEFLLFIFMPCLGSVVYEYLILVRPKLNPIKNADAIAIILALVFLVLAVVFHHKLYTFYTCLFSSLLLQFHIYFLKGNYLGKFFFVFALTLVPTMIIHGVLTSHPIIQYNSGQIIGIRIGNVPFENILYLMIQFLIVITIVEAYKSGRSIRNIIS